MIIEGLKLMFVGMTTVLLFLLFMIMLIQLVSRLTRKATATELAAIKSERERMAQKRLERESFTTNSDIAVIAAAVAAFEAERFAKT